MQRLVLYSLAVDVAVGAVGAAVVGEHAVCEVVKMKLVAPMVQPGVFVVTQVVMGTVSMDLRLMEPEFEIETDVSTFVEVVDHKVKLVVVKTLHLERMEHNCVRMMVDELIQHEVGIVVVFDNLIQKLQADCMVLDHQALECQKTR